MADKLPEVDASVFADFEFDDEPVQSDVDASAFADFEFWDEAEDEGTFSRLTRGTGTTALESTKQALYGNELKFINEQISETEGNTGGGYGAQRFLGDGGGPTGMDPAMMSAFRRDPRTPEQKAKRAAKLKDEVAQVMQKFERSEQRIKDVTPKDLSVWEEGTRAGLISVTQMLPTTLASLAARSPAPLVLAAGAQAKGSAYIEGKSKGLDEADAQAYAATKAITEAGTELIPGSVLVKAFGKRVAGKPITKELLKFAMADLGGEQLATALETLTDYAYGLDEQLANATTREEKIAIIARRQAVAGIAAVVGAGVQGGATVGAAVALAEPEVKDPDAHETDLKPENLAEQEKADRWDRFYEDEKAKAAQEFEAGTIDEAQLSARIDPETLRAQADQLESSGELARQYPTSYTDRELKSAQQEIGEAPLTVDELIETGGDLSEADARQFDETGQKRIAQYVKDQADRLGIDPTEDADQFGQIVGDAVALEHSGHLKALDDLTPRQKDRLVELLEDDQKMRDVEQAYEQRRTEGMDELDVGLMKVLSEPSSTHVLDRDFGGVGLRPRGQGLSEALKTAIEARRAREGEAPVTQGNERDPRFTQPPKRSVRPVKPAEMQAPVNAQVATNTPSLASLDPALTEVPAANESVEPVASDANVSTTQATPTTVAPTSPETQQPANYFERDTIKRLVGERGLRAAAGQKLDIGLRRIYNSMPDVVREDIEARIKQEHGKVPKDARARMVAEEYLRQVAAYAPQTELAQKGIALARRWLSQSFPHSEFSDQDILDILATQPKSRPVKKAAKKKKPEKKAEDTATTEEPAPKADTKQEKSSEANEKPEPATPELAREREEARLRMEKTKQKLRPPLDQRTIDRNKVIAGKHKTLWQQATDLLQKHLRAGGLMPRAVFKRMIEMNREINAYEFDIETHLAGLNKALRATIGRPYRKLSAQTKKDLNRRLTDPLTGPPIPQDVEAEVLSMRMKITELSSMYAQVLRQEITQMMDRVIAGSERVEALENQINLMLIIEKNMDTYVHRSYAAFEDPGWRKYVTDKKPEVIERAREFLKAEHADQDIDPAKMDDLVDAEMARILEAASSSTNMVGFATGGKIGAKNETILKRRGQVPKPIRELLGEYEDLEVNFASTVTALSNLVFNTQFLNYVREIGMGEFLFDKAQAPPWADTMLAAEGSNTYEPLNGLYTSKEIADSFKQQFGADMPSWLKYFVRFQGFVKYGATVHALATTIANLVSGSFFMMASGHSPRAMYDVTKKMQSYFSRSGGGAEYLRRMVQLGVIYDTPRAGVMKELLDDTNLVNWLTHKTGSQTPKRIANAFQRAYSLGDDFWKMIGFEAEKARLMKYANMTEEQAETEAAERIRNAYPTYSLVGKAQHQLRIFPGAGTFVAFPSEMIRTTGNNIGYAIHDAKHHPKIAAQRAVGMTLAAGGVLAVTTLAKALVGVSDEEEEAVHKLGPEWARNSKMLYVGRDEKGQPRYIDTGRYDPYSMFKRVIYAILRGDDAAEKAWETLKELALPFFGEDMTVSVLREWVSNEKESGAPVYNPADTRLEQGKDVAVHLGKGLLPGNIRNLDSIRRAYKGEWKPHRSSKYDLSDEIGAYFGFRVQTFEPAVSLRYRASDFAYGEGDVKQILTSVLRNINIDDPVEVRKAVDRAYDAHLEASRDLLDAVRYARQSGVPEMKIEQALRLGSIATKDRSRIMNGAPPLFDVSDITLKNMINVTRELVSDMSEVQQQTQMARVAQERVRQKNLEAEKKRIKDASSAQRELKK